MPVFFSLDPNFFKNHANSCKIQNGTTVYSNRTIPEDCSCVAPIAADPDFAGPGILASFIFFAWLTIAVATVPAFYVIRQSWRRNAKRKKRRIWMFVAELFGAQYHDTAKKEPPDNVARDELGMFTSTDAEVSGEIARPFAMICAFDSRNKVLIGLQHHKKMACARQSPVRTERVQRTPR